MKTIEHDNLCRCGQTGKLKFDERDNPAGIWCTPCWKRRHIMIAKGEVIKDLNKKLKVVLERLINIENDIQRSTSGNISHVKGSILHNTRSAKIIIEELLTKK